MNLLPTLHTLLTFSPTQNLEWILLKYTCPALFTAQIAAAIVEVFKRFDNVDTIVSFFISVASNIFQVQLELTAVLYNSPQKVLFAPSAQIIGSSQTQNWKILHPFVFSSYTGIFLKGPPLSLLSERGVNVANGGCSYNALPDNGGASSTIQNPYHHHYPE